MPDENHRPGPNEIYPSKIEKLLEVELMQKRNAWQQAKTRRHGYRALSFLFLFLVIVAAAVAFFVLRSGTGVDKALPPEPTPTVTRAPR